MGVEQPRSFFGNMQYFKDELTTLTKAGYAAIVFAETDIQAERIAALLKEFAVEVEVAGLSAGFVVPALKLLVVQENEIFGRRKRQPEVPEDDQIRRHRYLRRALARRLRGPRELRHRPLRRRSSA